MEFAEKEKKKSNSKNPVTQKQRGIFFRWGITRISNINLLRKR